MYVGVGVGVGMGPMLMFCVVGADGLRSVRKGMYVTLPKLGLFLKS